MKEDFYKILQISCSAESEVVKAAYKALSQKYHPDRNTFPDAEDIMKQLNEAYEVLYDSQKRDDYNKANGFDLCTTDKQLEVNKEQALMLLRGETPGIAAWNQFRAAEDSIPNLSQVDLSNKDLRKANLSSIDLSGANLQGAMLLDVDLSNANLSNANLTSVDGGYREVSDTGYVVKLINVNFIGANLTNADLQCANLEQADVTRAILTSVNLKNAKVSGVKFYLASNLDGATLPGLSY